jgi:hypothetical protein
VGAGLSQPKVKTVLWPAASREAWWDTRTMKKTLGVALPILLGVAAPVFPCSIVGPLPTPIRLIEQADLVVQARAEEQVASPGVSNNFLAKTPWQVRFRIVAVHKGTFAGSELTFNGRLEGRDDLNDRPVPYDHVRPGGSGSCYALGYRQGAQYLLLLKRSRPDGQTAGDWTPYWAPLGPTNEQLRNESDPWLTWVVEQIKRRKPGA